MLLERFEDSGLSQYSYVVGCPASGEAAIVDPRRDIGVYLDFAADRGLRIRYVIETHIHADFASGARQLGEESGAPVLVSGHDQGEAFEVAFAHHDLRHGDAIEVGAVRLEAVHTPGHTPEHMSYLVYDGARSSTEPMALLSGDFLFVGSLGRPDLLGEEAKLGLANQLYESVQGRLAGLPDWLEVLPAHGSGSMCGSNIGGRPASTLGYERITNPYLDPRLGRDEFVELILGSVPPFPDYYRRMKALNALGAPSLALDQPVPELAVDDLAAGVRAGAVVVDVRDDLEFGASHVPRAYNIGLGDDLSTWAAWYLPYETPLVLVAPDIDTAREAVVGLARVGLDDVRGSLRGGMSAWIDAGKPTVTLPQLTLDELERGIEDEALLVLDVREDNEWESGHLATAVHVRGGDVPRHSRELAAIGRPVAVICQTGYRSSAAASVLQRDGVSGVANVPGGVGAWQAGGRPLSAG